jgi:aspartate/methionine/tyrosine aminotransferase
MCFSRDTMEDIATVAKEKDLLVIADDIYTALSFAEPFVPMMTLQGMKERTVTIGSFSKDYCMTGWRVGYVIAPPEIIHTMKDVNENNVFTAPSVSQRAAIHALRLRSEVQPPMVAEYRKRMFYAFERISNIPGMSTLPPRGSLYIFINIKATGLSSEEVADRILREAHVLTLPGNAFGESGEGYLRIAVTMGLDQLKEAFDRIEKMEIFS